MANPASDLISYLVGWINLFKPRFDISDGNPRCRERVRRGGSNNAVIMIRADVVNFGWKQTDPPPCEIHLTRITHNDAVIENAESCLNWTDADTFNGIRVVGSHLVDICSVDESNEPVIRAESEKGKKGYSIDRGAGIYRFDFITVCKGSSYAKATLAVSFLPNSWDNIYIVSLRNHRAKWRHYINDVLALLVVAVLGLSIYFQGTDNHGSLLQTKVVPEVDLSLGQPFASSTMITLKNSGIKPIVDVAANLRCFLLEKSDDLHPTLFFEGFRSIGNANSWWTIDQIDPGAIHTKDAKESLVRCLHNRQSLEQSQAGVISRVIFTDMILAVDIVYRREIDRKQYEMSGIARLIKDSRTGEPYLWPLTVSDFHRHLLETVTAPNYGVGLKRDLGNRLPKPTDDE